MILDSIVKKYGVIVTVLMSTLVMQSNFASEGGKSSNNAQQILKMNGKPVVAKTEKWQRDEKDIPKDWVKIKNKYFSVSYPGCFAADGEGGEDDVKLAPSIQFSRKESCPGYQKNFGDSNSIGIGIESGLSIGEGNTLEAITESDVLYFQNLVINGIKAKLFVKVLDTLTGNARDTLPQLTWKIYIACNKNILSIASSYPMGKVSMDRINKKNYTLPEDFMAIAGSFRCGSVPYWTPPK